MTTPIEKLLDEVEWRPCDSRARTDADGDIAVATHEGYLHFGEAKLRVFQLSNGMRVIDADDLERFFGVTDDANPK